MRPGTDGGSGHNGPTLGRGTVESLKAHLYKHKTIDVHTFCPRIHGIRNTRNPCANLCRTHPLRRHVKHIKKANRGLNERLGRAKAADAVKPATNHQPPIIESLGRRAPPHTYKAKTRHPFRES